MEIKRRQPIGVELVKRGIVKESDINDALEYQRNNPDKKIGEILYLQNACDPRILIEAIGDILGSKGILLSSGQIKLKISDYISTDIAKQNKAIPFEVTQGRIKVCFPTTTKNKNMDSVRMLMLNKGLVMESYITFESEIDKIIKSLEGSVVSDFSAPKGKNDTVTSLVDSIIMTGIERRASDIHIEPMQDKVRVRYRIDGELFTATEIEKDKQSQLIGRLKAISNMHQEKQEAQDGRISTYDDYNIRVSSQPNVNGEKFVLRLLKKNENVRSIFELGFPYSEEVFKKTVNKRNSITIIAAPTGEGKTTSLYSIVDYLNRPEINITTIEDPIEIRIDGINQIEIDAKASFSNSLRTVLRQDPDIILLGEVRDKETGEIAIQAGQTGHYVLSTIHTIDCPEVVTRLRKMGISDYDISSTLATCISQRLVRRLCPKCMKEREFNKEEKDIIKAIGDKYGIDFDISGHTYDAVGCKHCNNTGYYERIGIFEVLNLTDEIKQEIMNGNSSMEIRDVALKGEYKPLIVDGINKVIQGYTTLNELNNKLLIY